MKPAPSAEVVVSTYERPDALRAVLASLEAQSSRAFTIAVADDGSGPETTEVIEDFRHRSEVRIRHVWHEDAGFRLAAIRNRAIAGAKSDYVLLLDGDCIVPTDFVANHVWLAEPGFFVRGSRIKLGRELTKTVLTQRLPVHDWGLGRGLTERLQGRMHRVLPMLRVPLGPLRKVGGRSGRGVAGANLGLWRRDVVAVNGFDERFVGYGYEDWEFIDRLRTQGLRRKNGRFAVPMYHLWHEEQPIDPGNWQRWQELQARAPTRAEIGLDRYPESAGRPPSDDDSSS